MADPQTVVHDRLAVALRAMGHPDADPVVRPSSRADYQVNGALALGKALGRSPRSVAEQIVATLEHDDVCSQVEIAGPGFINLTLHNELLVRCLDDVRAPRWGVQAASVPERVVIDYSGPNVAKEMHVGHLRSTVIGDALARTLAFVGHEVIRQNHLGDWGTPFGMLIEHLLDEGSPGDVGELSIGDLNAFYRAARVKFDSEESFAARSRHRVVALQAGDAETLRLWRVLVERSERSFGRIYERLGVTLSDADSKGESSYNDLLDAVVDDLRQDGHLVESDGALCVFPAGFTGREGDPLPLIVRKRDGGYGYAATDLAALRERVAVLQATRLLYVVGSPQADHLAMVFAVAREAGWLTPPARAEHVNFGSVLGEDGRVFRTRGGDTVRLADLLDEAVARAATVVLEKNPDLAGAAQRDVARAVGIGAVKYADLSSDRGNDYTFDWDRMLSLYGNTAPYLQYAHARVRSIFRRASGGDAEAETAPVLITADIERQLVVKLLAFDQVVSGVADTLRPHRLCSYLFELAQTFSAFYEQCPVLKAEHDLRLSRLSLCAMTAGVLATGLDLLGIDAPEQI